MMSEQELNELIAGNITRLLDEQGKTQLDLAEYMGVAQSTVSYWCKGIKVPRMSKIDKICRFFGVKRSDILGTQNYYDDPAVQKIAQEIYYNPEYRILFDAARDSKPEDLHMAAEILKKFKETNPDG